MSKLVVVLRHGRARKAAERGPDEGRPLTRAGLRAIEAHLPRALGLIGPKERRDLVIWTSGALRARQTADVAARALGAPVVERGFLANQDMPALLDALSQSQERCVVVVGHNPLLERAVERLSGVGASLAPGGMAAVSVPDDLARRGELAWIVQGPDDASWKTLVRLERTLRRRMDDVSRRLDAFLDDPEDAERLHELRIASRVMRGLLGYARPFLEDGLARELERDLRDLVSPTPRLRELDVLMEQVAGLGPEGEGLMRTCERLRRKECGRTCKRLRSKSTRKTMRRCLRRVRHLRWSDAIAGDGLSPLCAQARLEELFSEVQRERETVDHADAHRSHLLRKRAKAVRYAAENVPGIPPKRARAVVRAMKSIQDELGRLCDARCNLDIVESLSQERLDADEKRALEMVRAQNLVAIHDIMAELAALRGPKEAPTEAP